MSSDPLEHRSLEARLERLERLVERLYALMGEKAEGVEEQEGAASAPALESIPEPIVATGEEPLPEPEPPPGPAGERAGPQEPVHERATAGVSASPIYSGVPLTASTPGGIPAPPKGSFDLNDLGENWISRVGVALFLLGLGFAFKYAFDQGWITPLFRVAIGVQIGALFLVMGLRLHQRRPLYSQVLLGGAIGTFYLTGWAAFQLYGLVGHGVALSWMSAVTVLALALAETKDQSTLAAVGAFGGLVTPFALHTGAGAVPELVGYTTLLLGWTAVIYLRRGWLGLLGVISAGGLLVMVVAAMAASPGAELWIAQAGVTVAWFVAGVLPFVRQRLRLADPERWPAPRSPFARQAVGAAESEGEARTDPGTRYDTVLRRYLVLAGIAAGLVAGLVTVLLWDLEPVGAALVLHAEALVLAVVAWWALDHRALLASPAVETAAVLLVAGTVAFLAVPAVSWLDPELLYPALALEALLFLSLRREMGLTGVAWVAHLVFASLAVAFAGEVSSAFGRSVPAAFDVPIPFRLTAVAAAFGAGFVVTRSADRTAYFLAAHIAFLLWLAAVLYPLQDAVSWITLAWGAHGIVLLALSIRLEHRGLRATAFGTLALVVAKLILVDTAQVEMIWRVLLFMGFGAAFLALGYFLRSDEREVVPDGSAEGAPLSAGVPPSAAERSS